MRRLLLLAASLVLAPACSSPEPIGNDPRPSIVVVTIDTLRADHLGCYGYPRDTSPHIDRFAEEALLFENAFSTIATTLPSHVSLWTSRYPLETGVLHNRVRFDVPEAPDRRIFLAQWLRDAGWDTAAFVSAKPLARTSGVQAGFAHYVDSEGEQRTADETTDLVVDWLRARPRGAGAFLLWVHYFDPHYPHKAPREFRRFDDDGKLGEFLGARAFEDPEDPQVLKIHDRYDAEVAFVDSEVARLFGALRRHQDWSALTVVLTADHGEGLLEHGWWSHARLHNEQIRIPLIIKFPERLGVAPGRRSELASSIDVVPTLVAALDLPVPEARSGRLRGVDLLSASRDRAFAQKRSKHQDGEDHLAFSVLDREWKYFYRPHGRDSLYDLRNDPNERVDVIETHPEVAERLRAQILAWHDEHRLEEGLLAVDDELDPVLAEHLRALGYVE